MVKFILDAEQRLFGETLHKLLAGTGTPEVIRAWAGGAPDRGLALWRSLADAGVFALAVPESAGGAGPLPVELVTAFHELGRHAVPGPLAETVAAAELLARLRGGPGAGETRDGDSGDGDSGDGDSGDGLAAAWLPRIAEGTAVVSLALPPAVPYALDADAADLVLAVDGDGLRVAAPGTARGSLDPSRRLFPVGAGPAEAHTAEAGEVLASGPAVRAAASAAFGLGALACAAQLVGLGRRLLEATVEYAGARRQFGQPIGAFQAVKHQLADVLVDLEYARPLVHGAALAYGSPDFARDVSAAKAAASEAAYAAARTALQVHGAIGYTDEYDLSLWIRKARALRSAWGSPAEHRARLIASLTGGRGSGGGP
ncbi:acyl-CoA dehydrogenase family protein [Planomonospora venezuelensis]|uniref:Alkylation response protein AidB-like acyl-CoA dehydrogenase n=1 Tax=Planomonospora venezuelensis TaxID=1999 RepID=A0A841DE22_PLAVE|nr:acyl-CoA dehydrogenase family protein [Planomonospora venezuelensis]MBB5967137.1 alkylation response protein AidB-like acyl-CoA dehydrogenase [Planomonospora venezuelensis]GIN04868.1 putative acyl-CoA dehydrogenase FadE [Planomonospora venezuelensis]